MVRLKREHTPLIEASVSIYSAEEGMDESFSVATDTKGKFLIRNVPIGKYRISASGTHHSATDQPIEVREAQASHIDLEAIRSQPDLNVAEARQPVFTTLEKPFLPVQGYGKSGDTLKIKLWHTSLSKMLAQPGASEALQRMTSTYEGALPDFPQQVMWSKPEQIGEATVKVAQPDREGFFVQRLRLPIDKKEHGLYLVQVQLGATKRICSWALVTDTALVLKSAPDGSGLAYVTDLTSGKPVAGAKVGAVATDADGLAAVPAGAGQRLIAVRGEDEASLTIGNTRTENRGSLIMHAWTDRTIYRPGHTVSWKAVLRERENDGFRVVSGLPTVVTVQDARGGEVKKQTMTTSAAGTLSGSFAISSETETGQFTLKLEAAGETYTTDILVAAYRKPEFEASATPTKPAYLHGETAEFTITSKYYFGSPVAGAKVTWQVYREGDWSASLFEPGLAADMDEEEIESLRGDYYGEKVAGGKGVLDKNGRLVVTLPVNAKEGAPSVEQFTLSATITDSSERTTDVEATVRVAAGDLVLSVEPEGYVAVPGKETRIMVRATDLAGKLKEGVSVSLQPALSKWDAKEEKLVETPLGAPLTGKTGPDGQAALSFTPTRSGEVRLHATAQNVEGTGSLYVLSDDESSWEGSRSSLTILTDKRQYRPGDTANILVSATRPGANVLVTVEGDALYEKRLLRLTGRATRLTLPIRPEWGPNVTLAACSVREKSLSQSQVPLRVSMPQKELQVAITPELPNYGPGQKARFTIQLTDGNGKPAPGEFSFSLVDEAIYALKPDDSKDLRKAFYPHRSNSIETRASFEVTYLSGESKSDNAVAPRRKFLDTALWLPSVTTDASGKATVEAPLPDNLTAWRATVRAVTASTAVGYGTAKITTTKPFFVRLELPRFLVQGDTARALALVHNETGQPQNAAVTFNGQDQNISVASGSVGKIAFPLTAGGPLRLTAKAGSFTDGVEQTLAVRPFGRERTTNKSGIALNGGAAAVTLETDSRAIPESLGLDINVAPGLAASFDSAVGYLSDYPYGCVEQTTSRFLPAMLLGKADEKRIRDGLTRLRKLQHSSGAWGWWENGEDDPWMTGYALLALTEASHHGWSNLTKEPGLRGVAAARKILQTPLKPDSRDSRSERTGRALMALALARTGEGGSVVSALRQLDIAKASDTELALWTLAAVAAQKNPGDVWPELQRRAVISGALLSWRGKDNEWDSSDRMATALGLRALLAMNPTDPRAERALRWLLTSRTGDGFGSTRDTAFVLLAFHDWLAARPDLTSNGVPIATVNGKSVPLSPLPAGGFRAHIPASSLKVGHNEVTLKQATFWNLQLTQAIGKDPMKGEITPEVPEGVIIDRDYLPENDERVRTSFKQGDNVRVRLTMTVPKELEYVAIEDAFPAGFEPTERGTAETETDGWNFWYDYVDVRDDRIALFVRRMKPGRHVFTYRLRAQTPGHYGVLPATLAPMYVEDFVSASRGATVEVTE
ncbi:MAG: MG2 domain-containing protein [Armatimonas sp.]